MSRQLSKGTLGLKFMNRVQPTTPGSPASPAPAPPTPASALGTPTAKPAPQAATPQPFTLKEDIVAGTSTGDGDYTPVASCSRHIIHESSLLSFPMLGSYDSTSAPASGASASHFALTAYSSMALSSFTVSGRRSFGGANADIERLNNPHQQPDAPEEVARDKESASQRKKRKQAERDGATVTGRTLNVNTPRPSAGAGRAVLEEGSAGKKQKTRGQGAEAFAKPGGFEGARAGGAKGKGRQAKAEPESDFDADASFDEAALDSSESSEDEGEGESSEGEVEAFLKSAVAPSATSLAVAAAEAGFIDDEAPALVGGAAEAGLTKNQKRKLAMKRAKEEADKRKGRKGGP